MSNKSAWSIGGPSQVLNSLARSDQAMRTALTTVRKLSKRDAEQGRTSGVLCKPWGSTRESAYSHDEFLDFVKRSATWRSPKKQ